MVQLLLVTADVVVIFVITFVVINVMVAIVVVVVSVTAIYVRFLCTQFSLLLCTGKSAEGQKVGLFPLSLQG